MSFRTRNRLILGKVETTAGTDPTPTPAADAILCENPQHNHEIQPLDTDEVTGSLDPRAPVVGGGGGVFSALVNLKGADTAGQAPEFGVLLRGCGFAETLLASAVTGTAQTGATGSITLAVGDGASVAIGNVVRLTGGTGSGQSRVITAIATDLASVFPDWTTAPDATSTYSVDASALYVPASEDLKNITLYNYLHANASASNSVLTKLLGAMGNVQFTIPNRGIPQAQFSFRGRYVKGADVSRPSDPTYDSVRPIAFQNADASLAGTDIKLNTLTLDAGLQVELADDPSDEFGTDVADIVRRRITGQFNVPFVHRATRDVFTDFAAGTDRAIWLRWGAVAGNRMSLYIPAARYSGQADEDLNGLAYEQVPFAAQGEDTGVYLNFY